MDSSRSLFSRLFFMLIIAIAPVNSFLPCQPLTPLHLCARNAVLSTKPKCSYQCSSSLSQQLRSSIHFYGSKMVVSGNVVCRLMLPNSLVSSETIDSWRQYVPLIVSCLVILDILLGSPFANSVINLIRRKAATENEDEINESPRYFGLQQQQNRQGQETKERVDSSQIAQAAIEKAQATMELRKFLDQQKTDWDRMEEIRRKMDEQMKEFDETMEKKRQSTE